MEFIRADPVLQAGSEETELVMHFDGIFERFWKISCCSGDMIFQMPSSDDFMYLQNSAVQPVLACAVHGILFLEITYTKTLALAPSLTLLRITSKHKITSRRALDFSFPNFI